MTQEETYQEFFKLIDQAVNNTGLSREEIADLIGTSYQQLGRWFRRETETPNLKTCQALIPKLKEVIAAYHGEIKILTKLNPAASITFQADPNGFVNGAKIERPESQDIIFRIGNQIIELSRMVDEETAQREALTRSIEEKNREIAKLTESIEIIRKYSEPKEGTAV